MTQVIIGRWGRSLALRVPQDVAQAAGLTEGEAVEIETDDGDIIVRRPAARAKRRGEAEEAALGIIRESRRHSLGGATIRELLDEGRR
jgi:antitoxin MazE